MPITKTFNNHNTIAHIGDMFRIHHAENAQLCGPLGIVTGLTPDHDLYFVSQHVSKSDKPWRIIRYSQADWIEFLSDPLTVSLWLEYHHLLSQYTSPPYAWLDKTASSEFSSRARRNAEYA